MKDINIISKGRGCTPKLLGFFILDHYGRNLGKGKLIVRLGIKIPTNINNEQKEIFEKLKEFN
jgi:DnaJ-class molecular chaperone